MICIAGIANACEFVGIKPEDLYFVHRLPEECSGCALLAYRVHCGCECPGVDCAGGYYCLTDRE